MELKDKHVSGLAIKMLGHTNNMPAAKACTTEALYALAERDVEWVNFIKEKYGVEYDFSKTRSLYEQAIQAIKQY
jgi:hypothetical protein